MQVSYKKWHTSTECPGACKQRRNTFVLRHCGPHTCSKHRQIKHTVNVAMSKSPRCWNHKQASPIRICGRAACFLASACFWACATSSERYRRRSLMFTAADGQICGLLVWRGPPGVLTAVVPLLFKSTMQIGPLKKRHGRDVPTLPAAVHGRPG